MNKIVIFGATSGIAREMIRLFAARGDALFLVARDESRLKTLIDDAKAIGGNRIGGCARDLDYIEKHDEVLKLADEFLDNFDKVIVAHGVLGDQKKAEFDVREVERIFLTNARSAISILTLATNELLERGQGQIAYFSSPAALRGRASNYVYGASKAAVSTFLSGLRQRLHKSGVHVVTIYPGFVDTPMTRDFKKGFLWAKPEAVAKHVIHELDQQRSSVIFVPWFWRWIMLCIRLLPESLFLKLKI